jgi:acetaldehyde dehydrogenase/alcohol dehydrogenase
MACGDRKAAFRAAILDPEVTVSQPAKVTAVTGIDALSHALESYVTTRRNALSQLFAREAWRLLEGSFERVLRHPDDLAARGQMQVGANLAGLAIENAMLGAAHACANPLTAHYGITHGIAIGVLLPHVIRYNGKVPSKFTGWPKYETYRAPERFQDIARHLGLPCATPDEAVEAYASAVERLRDAVGIQRSFQEVGIDEQAFLAGLPQQALNAYRDQCAPANPRMPMLDDMQALMRAAYYGS